MRSHDDQVNFIGYAIGMNCINEIAKLKRKVTKNIRPIFTALMFSGNTSQKSLLAALNFLKKYIAASTFDRKKYRAKAPIACLPKSREKYCMTTDGEGVDMQKYEFMIYQLIIQAVEAGELHLADSISFKSLSACLLDDTKWKSKKTLLKRLANPKLLMPVESLLMQTEDGAR